MNDRTMDSIKDMLQRSGLSPADQEDIWCSLCNIRLNSVEGRNILAVIHRDGGHHTREVGITQSRQDAEKIVNHLREERGALRLLLADIMDDATGDARDEEKRTWPLRIDNWRKGRALLDSSNKVQGEK